MFSCTVCQRLYAARADYCDCGNDTFEEIHVEAAPQNSPKTFTLQDILSRGIFAVCILLSIYVLFFTGTKNVHRKSEPVREKTVQAVNIPSIDSIWDNTPAQSTVSNGGSEIDIYKKGLQNLFYSNLATKTIQSSGECEIEFRIASDGSLTNRKMYKRQGDKIFNKTILDMLKKTTSYKTPPADYTGEKIKAYVYTNNDEIKIFIK